MFSLFILLFLNNFGSIPLALSSSSSLPLCEPKDLKYDFTECDSFGGKWRVLVPDTPGHCRVDNVSYVPTRIHECYTSCEGGQFFNKTTLLCEDCKRGHYSLSGGIVFENFNGTSMKLPDGFRIVTESRNHFDGWPTTNQQTNHENNHCPEWKVDPISGSLVSIMQRSKSSRENDRENAGCASAITYTVKIVKRGRLRFTYHYRTPSNMPLSLLFTFNYRLYDGLGMIEDDINTNIKFPMLTMEKSYETIELQLNTPGLYIFTWKSIVIKNFRNYFGLTSMDSSSYNYDNGFFEIGSPSYGSDDVDNNERIRNKHSNNIIGMVRIKKIIIEGLAYASECTPCEPGTYAPESGMKECLFCPLNTAFNESGAIECRKCDPVVEYAGIGSTECSRRPICGMNDLYAIPKGSCDPETLQQPIEYQWIEPKICVDLNGIFPKKISYQNCTLKSNNNTDNQCDLGMELGNTIDTFNEKFCQFCPDGYYRDENIDHCQPCPPLTNPYYALLIEHWNNSLPGWFMDSKALSSTLASSQTNSNSNNNNNNFMIPFNHEEFFEEIPTYLNSFFSRQCLRSDESSDLVSSASSKTGFMGKIDENFVETTATTSMSDECVSEIAWQPFDNYIRTGAAAPLDSYLILSLAIPSFRSTNINETKIEFKFEFYCETNDECLFLFVETRPDESELRLQKDFFEKPQQQPQQDFNNNQKQSQNNKKKFSFSQQTINQVIKEWTQKSIQQDNININNNNNNMDKDKKIISFQHQIERNTTLTYSWIFKRTNSFQSNIKIYSLLLIGSSIGSAIRCQKCLILSKTSTECISCPHGQYLMINDQQNNSKDNSNKNGTNKENNNNKDFIDSIKIQQTTINSNNFQCLYCPKNHILNRTIVGIPIGIESCVKCEENLISDNDGNDNGSKHGGGYNHHGETTKATTTSSKSTTCYSNCLVKFNDNHQYNLRLIPQPILFKGINLFTSGGTQYMNLFKISLCGNRNNQDNLSTCLNNITVFSDDPTGVRSFICRSTIIPDGSKIFATQSASLGDELLAITRRTTFQNISVHKDFIDDPEANRFDKDYHLYFKTQTPTSACPQGRKLTITMRCNKSDQLQQQGQIGSTTTTATSTTIVRTPKSCPDGTCNGCDFHLLIETNTGAACRLCRPYNSDDYEMVIGECLNGIQKIHYVNPKGCVVMTDNDYYDNFDNGKSNNSSSSSSNKTKLLIINRPCSVLLPKQVQIGIGMAMILGLLLLLLVFYFWNKNRSLEYKYTKLIEKDLDGIGEGLGMRGRKSGGVGIIGGHEELSLDNCCVEQDDEDELNVNIIDGSTTTTSLSYSGRSQQQQPPPPTVTSTHQLLAFSSNISNASARDFISQQQRSNENINIIGATTSNRKLNNKNNDNRLIDNKKNKKKKMKLENDADNNNNNNVDHNNDLDDDDEDDEEIIQQQQHQKMLFNVDDDQEEEEAEAKAIINERNRRTIIIDDEGYETIHLISSTSSSTSSTASPLLSNKMKMKTTTFSSSATTTNNNKKTTSNKKTSSSSSLSLMTATAVNCLNPKI